MPERPWPKAGARLRIVESGMGPAESSVDHPLASSAKANLWHRMGQLPSGGGTRTPLARVLRGKRLNKFFGAQSIFSTGVDYKTNTLTLSAYLRRAHPGEQR